MKLIMVQWEPDDEGKEAPCFTCGRPLSESMPSWEWQWDDIEQGEKLRRDYRFPGLSAIPEDWIIRICNRCYPEGKRKGERIPFLVWAVREHGRSEGPHHAM